MHILCQRAAFCKAHIAGEALSDFRTRSNADRLLCFIVAASADGIAAAVQRTVHIDIGISADSLRAEINILETDRVTVRIDIMLGPAGKNNLMRAGHLEIGAVIELMDIALDRHGTGGQIGLLASCADDPVAVDIERIVLICHNEIALAELIIRNRLGIELRSKEHIIASDIERTAVQVDSAACVDQVALNRQRMSVQIQLTGCQRVVAGQDGILFQRSAVLSADSDMELTEIAGNLRCGDRVIGIDTLFRGIPDLQRTESGIVIRHRDLLRSVAAHDEGQIGCRIEIAALAVKITLERDHAGFQVIRIQITGSMCEAAVDCQAAVRVCHRQRFIIVSGIDREILTGQSALGDPQHTVIPDGDIAVNRQDAVLIRQRKHGARAVDHQIADFCRSCDRLRRSVGDHQILILRRRFFGRCIGLIGFLFRRFAL